MAHALPGVSLTRPAAVGLFESLAFALIAQAEDAVEQRGAFHLALSGGSTPEPFYRTLVIDPRFRDLPWKKTHVWLVDERQVPEQDERSNMKMIRETLTDHVGIPASQVHPMYQGSDDDAALYEQALRKALGDEPWPSLDFVLLGMGDDAHTASLFPHSPALQVRDRLVALNSGPHVTPPDRITLTYPLINAARRVAVLVMGEKKKATLARIATQHATGKPDMDELPITGIEPEHGPLHWYLDGAAAG